MKKLRPRALHRSRRRRAGFTLLELMVALAIGTLVVATMYTLSGTSAHAFQTQQRISQLQLQTRLALERVRRDVAATGFGGTPDSQRERSCFTRGIAQQLLAVHLDRSDPVATAAIASMPGGPAAGTTPDRLRLMGNFATSDTYLIANTGSASGNSILLQSTWQAFRRSFASDPLGTTVDTALFQSVFQAGRVLHIIHPRGYHFFTVVQGSSVDSAGRTPSITINPPLPAVDECNFALCVGCQVSPLMTVEYGIDTADNIAPALVPRDPGVTGTNTVLYRRELDPTNNTPIAGQTRVVLEWAVDFDVHVIRDTNGGVAGGVPTLTVPEDALLDANAHQVRALQISLAARTPDTDPSFPWVAPSGTNPALTRFRVFTDRPGAARVRTAMAEFVLENLAIRGM
jgi:prepilin-type N-terminal cleavage/methylation domain-containing protein